jgi:hypothetical protein
MGNGCKNGWIIVSQYQNTIKTKIETEMGKNINKHINLSMENKTFEQLYYALGFIK